VPNPPASSEREPSKVVEAFDALRTMLAEANQLAELLSARMARLQASQATPASAEAATAAPSRLDSSESRIKQLESDLEAALHDQVELTKQLVEAENLAGKLMSLYVATYQLHVSLDPVEVQTAIAEIAKDLLGASGFALLIKDEVEGGCEVALAHGVDGASRFNGSHYEGGDSIVDRTLEDGVVRFRDGESTEALAAVPLRVEEAIVGALVILRVLEHKQSPLSEDRDILDLLAAHAASALFAARVYSKTDRKLRTLQSLVNLIRGT
jgi:GAF domain-containing protein